MKLGLIVNPVAGLGGRVGLKGSDTWEIQQKALKMGARPMAGVRAALTLARLGHLGAGLTLLTCRGPMGGDAARQAGFDPVLAPWRAPQMTGPAETKQAARWMRDQGAELILFAGGDGTARDIYDAVGMESVVLGIPAGVKIHSPVYAVSPVVAGELAREYLEGRAAEIRECEVVDLDEEAIRADQVSVRLYGLLRVPFNRRYMQGRKSPSRGEKEALAGIAMGVARAMKKDVVYFLGPGTTTRAVAAYLGQPKTLIGVDAFLGGALMAKDLNERKILDIAERFPARIVVTPIGGQGFLFGRGNLQFSPAVIGKVGVDNIITIATQEKILSLGGRPLLVDTQDPQLDRTLAGYLHIITGPGEKMIYRLAGPEELI